MNKLGRFLFFLVISTSLASCSGDSGSLTFEETAPAPLTQAVILEAYESEESETPSNSGYRVVVHDDSNGIARTLTSGENGQTALGEFEDELSITIVFDGPTLYSYLNLPLDELEIEANTRVLRWVASADSEPEVVTDDLEVIVNAPDAMPISREHMDEVYVLHPYVNLQPIRIGIAQSSPDQAVIANTATYSEVHIVSDDLQEDNTVSFLAQVGNAIGEAAPRYGFALDTNIESGDSVSLTAALAYSELPVSMALHNHPELGEEGIDFVHFGLIGTRKKQDYELGRFNKVADQFPVDSYLQWTMSDSYYSASSPDTYIPLPPNRLRYPIYSWTSNLAFCRQETRSNEVPSALGGAQNVLDIQDFEFDLENRRASWLNDNPSDVVSQVLELKLNIWQRKSHWSITMYDNRDELSLPSLPDGMLSELLAIPDLKIASLTALDYLPSYSFDSLEHKALGTYSSGESRNLCTRVTRFVD